MGIDDTFTWYQQKIGAYDKQQWETKIERVEKNYGIKYMGNSLSYAWSHVQMRSTQPNTELIDLDLATGSSFTKTKAQHGFCTVVKLATFRYLLLPFYRQWWTRQTSTIIFCCLFTLYVAQLVNLILFYNYVLHQSSDGESISWLEILVPFLMMWILTLVQSEIVATTPNVADQKTDGKTKKHNGSRRRSNLRSSRRTDKLKAGKKTEKVQKKLKFKEGLTEQAGTSATFKGSGNPQRIKVLTGEDDGFESLNGNGSRTSEEEILPNSANPKSNLSNNSVTEDIPTVKENMFDCNQPETSTPNKKNLPTLISNKNKRRFIDAINVETAENGTNAEEQPNNNPRSISESNSDTDSDVESTYDNESSKRRDTHVPRIKITTTHDSTEEDDLLTSPESRIPDSLLNEVSKSSREWMGVTTNSEDCSFSSDLDDVADAHVDHNHQECFIFDNDMAPREVLNPSLVKARCIVWGVDEVKETDLSMLDISLSIITKVHLMPASKDYFYIGMAISTILALLPIVCRLSTSHTIVIESNGNSSMTDSILLYDSFYQNLSSNDMFSLYKNVLEQLPVRIEAFLNVALGFNKWERIIIMIATLQRWVLASIFFFLLAVAERTFKQRLLYAKLFSHLTSFRRAWKSKLPHFRLNKVRNIKTWLSVRSYLKRRGPQRSVDVIVSTAFIVTLLLLTFLCVELLKDTVSLSQYYLEALIWCLGLGILLLRFMTLGTKINKKFRNLSVLITEQINLHLQMEQKPHKKDELTVANNVLKLAIDLLKELENPFKISGLSANPILYNVTKLVILSALSGALSEMLGFKLKLHKIKLK